MKSASDTRRPRRGRPYLVLSAVSLTELFLEVDRMSWRGEVCMDASRMSNLDPEEMERDKHALNKR
jgi:hypothetical protein